MARLADVPLDVRMEAAARLCRQTDDLDERRRLFMTALLGRDATTVDFAPGVRPTFDDYDHLMQCVDPHCGLCAA